MFDVSGLPVASSKPSIDWRNTAVTILWLRADGPIDSAYTLANKRAMLAEMGSTDELLVVLRKSYPMRQEVLFVDDLQAVRAALEG